VPDPDSKAIFEQVLETGETYRAYGKALEFTADPGTTRVYWDWSLEPERDAEGKVTNLVLVITDVTAREKAQQALHQTQAMFVHLFETTPDANVLVDEEGTILAVNQLAENLFGYARNDLVGKAVEALVPEAKRHVHKHLREQFYDDPKLRTPLQGGRDKELNIEGRRSDGSRFPAEITLNPFQTNHRLLVLCVVRDISEKVARDKELEEQSRLVRLLQDVAVAANEANSVHDAVQFTIDRLAKHLHWPVGHALLTERDNALNPTAIWNHGLTAKFQRFKEASESMRFQPGVGLPGAVLETGQVIWFNGLDQNPDFIRQEAAQQTGLRTGLALPVTANREVVGVMEFFHKEDIPPDPNLLAILPHIGVQLGRVVERKRAEEALRQSAAKLQTVIVNLPVILWVINREGRLVLLDGKGTSALGLDPSELVGKIMSDRLENRPDIQILISRVMQGEEIHTEITASNGIDFDLYLTPYYDENWAVAGVIGLSIDISERKRMEAELEEMKHRLLESSENERSRLGQILHDGPLQDLIGAFYQIQDVKNNLPEGHALDMAERALQTIQQVSATLRVICGELRPSTLVHLGLQKAIRSHGERLQDRLENMFIYFDLADDRQSIPHNPRLGLFRIYQQIISNAIRHSDARHIWVRLRLGEGQAVLEVQDNGKGFDVPGHWIDLVREGRLGLVGALERAQGLGGKMEIRSKPGEGTTIRVSIPLQTE
jgi:PAS domain S-box-containing protein